MKVRFVCWDWKGPLHPQGLLGPLQELAPGPIYAVAVDDGGDDYVIALSTEPLSRYQASAIWRANSAG
jgi:hypothetical protein